MQPGPSLTTPERGGTALCQQCLAVHLQQAIDSDVRGHLTQNIMAELTAIDDGRGESMNETSFYVSKPWLL